MQFRPEQLTRHHSTCFLTSWCRPVPASRVRSVYFLLCLLLLPLLTAQADTTPTRPPAAAVASAHPLATEAGHQILAAGGNAFDAAIAVSAVLAVAEPMSSGFGGGGFWLLHNSNDGHDHFIDGREQAPQAAHRDMYLDQQGKIIPRLSLDGPLAAGIPGQAAALDYIARHFGRLPLARSLEPAIQIARTGFRVDARYKAMAGWRLQTLRQSSAAAAIFLDNNNVPDEGYLIKQPDLAKTLEQLAARGAEGFYHGPVAEQLVTAVRAAGGNWTLEDLANYQVKERTPIQTHYQGYTITSAPPPSSGGIAISTILNILAQYDLGKITANLGDTIRKHLIVEAMRRAYRDRAEYLGDPDFISIPIDRLTDPDYAAGLANTIRLDKAMPSHLLPGGVDNHAGTDTTHFSIIDQDGNRVSATLSINYPFGSGFVAAGTGILLNDEMDDFSSKPGTPNGYGLIGDNANAITAGKRPLSSMSPTFVESDTQVAILGTPGGSRIITMVLLGILDAVDGNEPASWVALPRYHHQFEPDRISYEPDAFSDDEIKALESLGHTLQSSGRRYGNMQAILWDKEKSTVSAASDPRGIGTAIVKP